MSDAIKGLKPALLWQHFYNISQIPRCSKHEDAVRQYVLDFAKKKGFDFKMDKVKNVVIRKPAAKGYEKAPVVVLQGHLDMVCEKNKDTQHDFSKDPIRFVRKDDWLMADGTTLGSDNGIGVAAALAVLDSTDMVHGPIEALFTIDEETGLTGAIELGDDMLEGRILLNMDSEEDGDIYIGCAGGKDTEFLLKLKTEPLPDKYKAVRVRVGGLQGGHSGLQIDAGLGNAIKLTARFLKDVDDDLRLRVMHIDGGSKHNAIPRECDAVVALPKKNLKKLYAAAEKYQQIYQNELHLTDPGVFVEVVEKGFDKPKEMLTEKRHHALLNMLYAMPHGVQAMSQAVPGLVETSTNLAVVKTNKKNISVLTSQRSSVGSGLEGIVNTVRAVGRLANTKIEHHGGYPAWQPNPDSQLLKIAQSVYKNLFKKDIHVKAIHAGLECGIIGAKYPGMDMISFGPTILGAHSPDERVQISTVEKFWKYLEGILAHLAKK